MFEVEFDLMFDFDIVLLVFDMFEFVIGVETGVDIGVGLARFVFIRFALLTELLEVASPQAIPNAATDKIAVSAIFFIMVIDLLSSQRLEILVYLTAQNRVWISPNTADYLKQAPL